MNVVVYLKMETAGTVPVNCQDISTSIHVVTSHKMTLFTISISGTAM